MFIRHMALFCYEFILVQHGLTAMAHAERMNDLEVLAELERRTLVELVAFRELVAEMVRS